MVLGTPLRRLRQRPIVDGVIDPQRQAEFAAGSGLRTLPYTLGSMVGAQPDTLEQRYPGHSNMRPMDVPVAGYNPLSSVREGTPLAGAMGLPQLHPDPPIPGGRLQPIPDPEASIGGSMTDLTRPIRPNGVPIYPGMSPDAAAAATASLAEKLNAAQRVYPGSAQRNYGSYGMQPTQQSRYMSNLGERADAVSAGARPMGEIPLEQQGFARSQGFGAGGQVLPGANLPMVPGLPENGPMYGQEQRVDLGPKNEYGLRSMRNFKPIQSMDPNQPLGTFGNSTLRNRPGGGHTLMGKEASDAYQAAVQSGVPEAEARREGMRGAIERMRKSPEFLARVEREKAKNAVAAQRKSDLKSWAMATKRGLPLDEGVAKRLGGGGESPSNPTFPLPSAPTGEVNKDAAVAAKERDQSIKMLEDASPAIAPSLAKIGMAGNTPFHKRNASEIVAGLSHPEFGKLGKKDQDAYRSAMGHYLRVHKRESFQNPDIYDEMHAYVSGDKKKYAALKEKRLRKAADAYTGPMFGA